MVVELKVKCEVEKGLATVTIVRIKDSPKSNAEGSGKKEGKKKTGKQKTESNKTVTTKSEKVAAVLRTDKEAQKRTPTKDDTEKQVTLKKLNEAVSLKILCTYLEQISFALIGSNIHDNICPISNA